MMSLRFALDCGFRRTLFEGDNEKIFKRIQNVENEDRLYFGFLIKEIQILQSRFNTCQCNFIHREANSTAHSMARLAHSSPNRVWIEEVPSEILDVYCKDLLN